MVLVAHAILLVMYCSVAAFFYYNKPDKINDLFGYRTRLSMKNEYTWREANQFSSSLFLIVALSTFVFQVIIFFCLEGMNSFLSATAFLTINSILMIPITELHLRSIFDNNGDFKSKPNSKS